MTSFLLGAPCVDLGVFSKLHKVRRLMIEKDPQGTLHRAITLANTPPPLSRPALKILASRQGDV